MKSREQLIADALAVAHRAAHGRAMHTLVGEVASAVCAAAMPTDQAIPPPTRRYEEMAEHVVSVLTVELRYRLMMAIQRD